MAETFTGDTNVHFDESVNPLDPPKSVDEARALARLRFKERVEQGETAEEPADWVAWVPRGDQGPGPRHDHRGDGVHDRGEP